MVLRRAVIGMPQLTILTMPLTVATVMATTMAPHYKLTKATREGHYYKLTRLTVKAHYYKLTKRIFTVWFWDFLNLHYCICSTIIF